MFNFKSLFLTTVATLGLAVNVQAYKDCPSTFTDLRSRIRWASDATVAYAKDNAKILEEEFHKVTQTSALNNFNNQADTLITHCTKQTESLSSLLATSHITADDAQESVRQFIFYIQDMYELVDSTFPAPNYPHLNTLFHKIIRDAYADMMGIISKK